MNSSGSSSSSSSSTTKAQAGSAAAEEENGNRLNFGSGEISVAIKSGVSAAAKRRGRITISQIRQMRNNEPMTFTLSPDVQPPGMPVGLLSAADMSGGYTGLVSGEVVVKKLDEDTPAAHAGLRVGDRLVKVSMKSKDGNFIERPIGVWSTDLASFQGTDARNE